MNLQIINPLTYPSWNEILPSHLDHSIFYTSNWARVLNESYDYNPIYFVSFNKKKLSFLVPLMEIKSALTGSRGVSLPFTDNCRPVCNGTVSWDDAFSDIIDFGKRRGWKYIEIRDGGKDFESTPASSAYYVHTLSLLKDEEKVYSKFRGSTKRNIKTALKEGVEVKVHDTFDAMKQFYRLNCITRKKHGLPPQPYFFFEKIFDHIISDNMGIIVLAHYKGKTIAGSIYFHFGNKAIYKYGASDSGYQHLRANNLVMWKAIKYYCKRGCAELSFGRTDMDYDGLRQFKSGWGVTESFIKYHKYDYKKRSFIKESGSTNTQGIYNKVFRFIPVPMSKIAGSILYRHVG